MGIEDKAAHSYGGKRTARVEVMYGGPGFSYSDAPIIKRGFYLNW